MLALKSFLLRGCPVAPPACLTHQATAYMGLREILPKYLTWTELGPTVVLPPLALYLPIFSPIFALSSPKWSAYFYTIAKLFDICKTMIHEDRPMIIVDFCLCLVYCVCSVR